MAKITFNLKMPRVFRQINQYQAFLRRYLRSRGYQGFSRFENIKNFIIDILYKKRGRYSRPFLHLGLIGICFFMVTLGPVIFNQSDEDDKQDSIGRVLATTSNVAPDFYTYQAEEVKQYRGGEIINHVVSEGETISSIAEKYGLDVNTVLWANDLNKNSKIKPDDELRILPIDGVRHKVKRGETIYSIGKKYGLEESQVQMVVDYPFNEFLNDETFDLVVGQYLMVPEGVKPQAKKKPTPRRIAYTPDSGSVTASGSFYWPAKGIISQGYSFYHKAIDVANRSRGPILASDSGVVTSAGWPDASGYGNRVIIDHGNGFVTLYAHLSVVQVKAGQRVKKGDVVGQMGSTGRSTGPHLHFEIRKGGALLNPFTYLSK